MVSRDLCPQMQWLVDSRKGIQRMGVDGMGKVDKAKCGN